MWTCVCIVHIPISYSRVVFILKGPIQRFNSSTPERIVVLRKFYKHFYWSLLHIWQIYFQRLDRDQTTRCLKPRDTVVQSTGTTFAKRTGEAWSVLDSSKKLSFTSSACHFLWLLFAVDRKFARERVQAWNQNCLKRKHLKSLSLCIH